MRPLILYFSFTGERWAKCDRCDASWGYRLRRLKRWHRTAIDNHKCPPPNWNKAVA
jgi:N6-adenosine-specific RNA methylase IME4